MNSRLHAMETPAASPQPSTQPASPQNDRGLLQVQVVSIQNNFPIRDAENGAGS